MNRSILTLTLIAVLAGAVPAGARAASFPTGRYDCTYPDSGRTFGRLTFTAKTYRWGSGKSGKYGVSGKTITFKSGSMKGVFKHAQWKKGSGGVIYINLFDESSFGHSSTDAQCLKRKS
jgi:hypothetical protein